MERNGGGSSGSGGGSGGRSRLHHKRRPGHRRNTQHNVATVEPICDMRKVVNGIVSVDPDKLNKLVQRDPIEVHYAVEEEPFASGMFATVRKCRHRINGVEYAAKYAAKIRYGQDCTTEILHEIALMSMCTTNPRIIHLIDVFDTPTHMILVMEYAPGGDLQTLMDDDMVPYERDAVKFVRQVLEGLLFLHERNMAHLDIKLQNVLLMGTFPDCDVKLCDLEISRIIVAGQEVRELLGTPDYVSPEILHYEPITLSADIWSVGVMAYVLLTGFTPFGGDTDQETFQNICHGQLDFPDELFEDISAQAEDFIRKTLCRDPSARPTVRECLKHPWLTSWKNVASHQRETISSESQRKTSSAFHNGGFDRPGAAACPRSTSNNGHTSAAAARSLQRALSKSREVLYERVAASNLRKSTSKSRERLCEMRLSVSRSRDHLCDLLQPSTAQSRERLHSLRNFSKSHEVLSLLSGEQSSSLMTPAYDRQSSLCHLLPSAQSLNDCFAISPVEQVGQTVKRTDAPPASDPPSPSREGSLSTALSESTETLCDEKEAACLQAEEVTPSNSRPASPKPNKLWEAEESENKKPESLPSTRAEAVASSLKRLSRVGPPPLQMPSSSEILTPPVIKSPWNWPSAMEPPSITSRTTSSNEAPNSPTPSPILFNRKLMTSSAAVEQRAPSTSLAPPSSLNHPPEKEAKSPLQPLLKDQRLTETVRQHFAHSVPVPVATLEEERASTVEIPKPRLASASSTPTEQQSADTFRSKYSASSLSSNNSTDPSRPRFSPSSASTLTGQKSVDTVSSTPSTWTREEHPNGDTAIRSRTLLATVTLSEQKSNVTGESKNSPPSLASLSTILTQQPSETRLRSQNPSTVAQTLTENEQQSKEPARPRQFTRTDTVPAPIDTSLLSESQQRMLPSILNRRRASWAYGSKQEDVAAAPPVRPVVGKKIEPKLSVSELITSFSHSQVPGTAAVATATVVSPANTGLIKPSSVKKLSVGTLFQHDAATTSTVSSNKNIVGKEKAIFKPVAASIQAFEKSSFVPSSTAPSSLTSTQRSTDVPTRSRPHHFSWDVRALPRLAEDVCSPPSEGPSMSSALIVPEEKTANQIQQQTKKSDSATTMELKSTESDADFGPRSGSVSSDTGCSSSSDLSDRSSEDVSDRSPRRSKVGNGGKSGSGEPELMEEVVTEPQAGWTGRPRSFSVQADISFLAQPWNRVCTGSVARAFEKFGTKVESDSSTAPSTSGASGYLAQRSRRQSTPGPFK